ncbi:MAG: hypothetical protein KTQ49_00550 [Candidatus Omnitrophica bacterium]|nr:hypothetical protein [Candidatus Omnitrophota bacterium]
MNFKKAVLTVSRTIWLVLFVAGLWGVLYWVQKADETGSLNSVVEEAKL